MGVTWAVRLGLSWTSAGNVDASDEPFEPNRLGSNSAAFEAGLRYSHHPARLRFVMVVVVVVCGFVLVFVV